MQLLKFRLQNPFSDIVVSNMLLFSFLGVIFKNTGRARLFQTQLIRSST